MRALAAVLLAPALLLALTAPVTAEAFPDVISLPDGFQPEGIAIAGGPVAYAGSLADGDVVRTDLRTGAVERLVDVDDRVAVGLGLDPSGRTLFVAGGGTGSAWVHDTRTGAEIAALDLTDADETFVNDVVVTREAAWFTDSFAPTLYRVPLGPHGTPTGAGESVALTGGFDFVPGAFNANGIAATPDGSALLVIQSATGTLYRVDPTTGAATAVAVDGDLSSGDGILLEGRRHLYVVRNQANTVTEVLLAPDLLSGRVVAEHQDPAFDVPTTIARFGADHYVVNARFGTPPTPTTEYSMVRVGG